MGRMRFIDSGATRSRLVCISAAIFILAIVSIETYQMTASALPPLLESYLTSAVRLTADEHKTARGRRTRHQAARRRREQGGRGLRRHLDRWSRAGDWSQSRGSSGRSTGSPVK